MKISDAHVSHLSVLIRCLQSTEIGDVLELGMGIGSTPVMHELCRRRRLVSYENDPNWYQKFACFAKPWHEMYFVEKWEDAKLEQPWGVALVDNHPSEERPKSILRLKDWADIIVVHDTEPRKDKHYGSRAVFPEFRSCLEYTDFEPHTTVLSNRWNLY